MSISAGEDAIVSGVVQPDQESCRCFSLAEIQSVTNNFNDALVIGVGGFGKVYKGRIDNGVTVVAIKRLNSESKQGAGEFWTEVKMLSKLQNTHLVTLIGYCNESNEMILVYEYMAYGTLADHLYKKSRKESGISISHLPWEKRLEISIGAARGLDYLHTGTNQSFIHRDVKTTNILLDEKWVAKISDFGLSKGGTSHSITHVSTDVKGTFGYLDPDYFYTRRLTKKSDVYAFGVVLLEVLCGRPAVDAGLEEEQISLIRWAQQCIENRKLSLIIDPSLAGQISPRCLRNFVELASNCLRNLPDKRPTMADVVAKLELILASQRKVRTEGIITKVFRGIGLVPKSGPSTQLLRRFSDVEIRVATDDFNVSHLISHVKHEKVYKGCIDGEILFIKSQVLTTQQLSKAKAEIELKPLIHHPNVVCLIGFCFTEHEAILVYEYMDNGSLQDHLYGRYYELVPWKKRLQICIDAARGLQYLYAEPTEVVLHRIKLSHILLDKKWNAKITDFTLSNPTDAANDGAFKFMLDQLIVSNAIQIESSYVLATRKHRNMTKQTYLYASFGILLFKVLCAKKPCAFIDWEDHHSVASLVKGCKSLAELGNHTKEVIIDRHVLVTMAPESFREFVKIASSCVLGNIQQRSSMDHVLERLQFALQLQEGKLPYIIIANLIS